MTDKNKQIGISKIALTNFQVFSERVEIPIEKITLLFGPNSAGKSAIGDALDIIKMIRTSKTMSGTRTTIGLDPRFESIVGNLSLENKFFLEKLKSCWRKSGVPARYTQLMRIEVERNVSVDGSGGIFLKGLEENNIDIVTVEESFIFFIHEDDFVETLEESGSIKLIYELSIEKELMLSYEEYSGTAQLNCAHKLISPLDFSYYFHADENRIDMADGSSSAFRQSKDDFVIASYINSVISFSGTEGFSLRGNAYSSVSNFHSVVADYAKNKIAYVKAFDIFSKKLQEVLFSVWWCEDGWISSREINFKGRYSPTTGMVDASRKTPTMRDLFVCSKNVRSSFLIESKIDISPSNSYIKHIENDRTLQRVNYFLSTQLFIDKGYYIGSESEYIEKNFETIIDIDEPLEEEEGRLTFTQFYLADHTGTKFHFDEVGSGLGYVFPVLCVLAQSEYSFVIIQQPELHLHPALQAAMGDVVIESSDYKTKWEFDGRFMEESLTKTIVIETHSEHLLLRILKRIRQTHLHASIAPDLKINADDVCVLYFNPLPDGTTTVKRLRITEDGEFMDRWPRGFFGERDQELLDE